MIVTMITHIVIAFAIIVAIAYFGNYISATSELPYLKFIVNWFVFLMALNIAVTTFIMISYSTIKFQKGPRGAPGRRGVQGAQGKEGSCLMCGPSANVMKQIRPEKLRFRFGRLQPREVDELFPERKK